MGEDQMKAEMAKNRVSDAVAEDLKTVATPGGNYEVRWNSQAAVTPFGQMAFFIEFLNLSGVLESWINECPLTYLSPNAPTKRDLLGTWLLSVLAGHKRYAHVTSIRSDGVNPELLGMNKVVSEDALRRGLEKIPEEAGVAWLQQHLERSVLPLLKAPWIMDVDTTVKVLYGKQEGAEVGYNPKKPGRPSHTYHTYLVAGLRLVLDAEVLPGNQGHSNHTLPGLCRILDSLPREQKPYLVRGDCGFGNDPFIKELEERGQDYIFKLRQTAGVKRFIEGSFSTARWNEVGGGWQATSGELRLGGWDRSRRVVVQRRLIRVDLVLETKDAKGQMVLAFMDDDLAGAKGYEYAVLVTSLPHEELTISQLYRDRGDAENVFDELKNQWGWGGFTTKDLHRCQLTARTVALVYNWWSLYVRLLHPKKRLEAVTSKPLLLTGIAERTRHARKSRITITPMHGFGDRAREKIARVSERLQEWHQNAEQLKIHTVWDYICDYLITLLTKFNWLVTEIEPSEEVWVTSN